MSVVRGSLVRSLSDATHVTFGKLRTHYEHVTGQRGAKRRLGVSGDIVLFPTRPEQNYSVQLFLKTGGYAPDGVFSYLCAKL